MESLSVEIKPMEAGNRYWAKIIRANMDVDDLPLPESVNSSRLIPGHFLTWGEDELLPGDILIEGEEFNPDQKQGWDYYVTYLQDGDDIEIQNPGSEIKAALKAAGMPSRYLTGSGALASAVRTVIGIKLGYGQVIASVCNAREDGG